MQLQLYYYVKAILEIAIMPVIKRIGPFQFRIWSNEGNEPAHVHVQRGGLEAKFWLESVQAAWSTFEPYEHNKIERLVKKHRKELLDAWRELKGN